MIGGNRGEDGAVELGVGERLAGVELDVVTGVLEVSNENGALALPQHAVPIRAVQAGHSPEDAVTSGIAAGEVVGECQGAGGEGRCARHDFGGEHVGAQGLAHEDHDVIARRVGDGP